MAKFVQKNCKIYFGGTDRSSDFNAVTVTDEYNVLDAATFGDDAKERICGIEDWRVEGGGLTDHADDAQDETMYGALGVDNTVVTIAGTTGAAGEPAYFGKAAEASYQTGGTHGELATFQFTAHASGSALIRGTVMHALGAETATNTGAARQLGAVSATQRVYAALHVTSASAGGTLDVVVQSDDAEGFPSATNRITFTQATAATSEMLSTAGAIADTWWRISWTIGGADPSFSFVVVVGIK